MSKILIFSFVVVMIMWVGQIVSIRTNNLAAFAKLCKEDIEKCNSTFTKDFSSAGRAKAKDESEETEKCLDRFKNKYIQGSNKSEEEKTKLKEITQTCMYYVNNITSILSSPQFDYNSYTECKDNITSATNCIVKLEKYSK
ncbi:hypothetical protein PGB90_008821 [Kerria lacca]